MSQLQYQSLAAPLIVATAPETITSDKWAPRSPDPVRRTASAALLMVAMAAPLFVPDLTNPVTENSWKATHPDRHVYRRAAEFRSYAAAPTYVPDVTYPVTALSWTPRYPDRIVRFTLPSALQQATVEYGVEIDVPVMAWTGAFADRVPSRRTLDLSGAVSPFTVEAPAQAPELSWSPEHQDQVSRLRLRASEWTLAAPTHVPDVTQPVTALSWRPGYPDRAPGLVSLRSAAQQAFGFDRFAAPDSIVVTPLSWTPEYPDRIVQLKLRPSEWTLAAPTYVPDVTYPVTALSWTPRYPDRIVRFSLSTAAQQAVARDRFDAPEDPTVIPLSWTPEYPDRIVRVRLKPSEWTLAAPNHVPDVTQPVTARSWAPSYPDRLVLSRAYPIGARTSFGIDRFEIVAPSVGGWKSTHPDRIFRKALRPAIWHAERPLYVPDVTQPVTARSWAPSYPDRVWGYGPIQRHASLFPYGIDENTRYAVPDGVLTTQEAGTRYTTQEAGTLYTTDEGGTIYTTRDA